MSRAAGVAYSICIAAATVACAREPIELGFWIDPVSYGSPRLGDPLSIAELASIDSIARAEIDAAFDRFGLAVSANHHARYHVRVVPKLIDQRFRHREMSIAGQSRAAAGFGGSGAVSFQYVADGAMVFSPETATRGELTAAIGRGIGRVAIHEFLHQLLPKFDIHTSRDARTYEGNSPALREGYFDDLHWGIAAALMETRTAAQ
jgi:hypothetical protein